MGNFLRWEVHLPDVWGLLGNFPELILEEGCYRWDELLPLAEFGYNNHIHSSIKQVPFYLDTERLPQMGFEPNLPSSKVEAVNEFAEQMKSLMDEVHAALAKAKDDMARYYNQRH